MHYLITGANGFLGSNLVKSLLKNPFNKVFILVRKTASLTRLESLLSKIKVLYLEEPLDFIEPIDICFHLAWAGVANYQRNLNFFDENHLLLQKILGFCKKSDVKKIIALGSQAEYGPKSYPIKEDEELSPTTQYGKDKVKICRILKEFCKNHKIDFVWVRLFSSYGPQDNPYWLIPSLILNYLNNRKVELTRGEQKQDFLFISDVAEAFISILEMDYQGPLNLGSSRAYMIKDVVRVVFDIINPKIELKFGEKPYREDESFLMQANMDLFFSKSSWRPKIDLKKGIDITIKSYKSLG